MRILIHGVLAAIVGLGCGTTPGNADGGSGAGGVGGGGGASSGRGGSGGSGQAGAAGGSGGGSAGAGGGSAGAAGAAAGGRGGAAGMGGRGGMAGGSGGSGGQGVPCGGGRCAPGDTCCYDIMGNGMCASPPAVCIGGPSTCNNGQGCAGGLFCDMNQPRRCLASAVGGICIETPSACARIYQPVCGCDGVTYGNDCERRRAHAQLDHEGECATADGGRRD